MDTIEKDGLLQQALMQPHSERIQSTPASGASLDKGAGKYGRQSPYGQGQPAWSAPKAAWSKADGRQPYGKGYGKTFAQTDKGGKGKKGDSTQSRGVPPERGTNALRTPPTATNPGGSIICFDHDL